VREQVPDGHRLRGGTCLERPPGVVVARQHLGQAEPRQIFRDRIVQSDLPLFDQHHDRRRGHRLGHRRNAEDGVLLHREVPRHILLAERLVVEDAVAADHHRHHAGHFAAGHRVAQERRQGGLALGGHRWISRRDHADAERREDTGQTDCANHRVSTPC
jgi:hypothetical protein